MATQIRIAPETVNPLDVSRAELWSEDRWQEPMRQLRADLIVTFTNCPQALFFRLGHRG